MLTGWRIIGSEAARVTSRPGAGLNCLTVSAGGSPAAGASMQNNRTAKGALKTRARKSEIRNPKSETNSKHEEENPKRERRFGVLNISPLVLWICFEFRASDFGFPVIAGLACPAPTGSRWSAACGNSGP